MESSTMVSLKAKENSTLQLETTILASLDLIRSKEEEFITGQEKKAMFIKDNSKQEKEMVEVLSGGQMVAGMKEISETVCKVDGEYSTDKEAIANMKVTGITACLMAKGHSISKTVNDMKAHSSKTNFTEKVYFTKMIQ